MGKTLGRMRKILMDSIHWCGKRAEARVQFALEAVVQTVERNQSGYLLNLSCHGAMVRCAVLPAHGASVLLKCGPLDVIGEVMWFDELGFGLQFDEPLPQEQVIKLRQIAELNARYRAFTSPDRPSSTARPLTREEWHLARKWTV